MSVPPFETNADPDRVDRVVSALGTDARRSVLRHAVASAARTASLEDLTEYVVARQSASDDREREEVRVRLHHVDLPMLDDAGALDYDPRTRTVRYREEAPLEEWDALVAAMPE